MGAIDDVKIEELILDDFYSWQKGVEIIEGEE